MPLPPTPADSPVIYGASLVIPTNPSWANSPIHQEVQEWEKESIRAQDVNKPSETLVAERDRLYDQLDQIILRLGETQERMIDAERQRGRLAAALRKATGIEKPEQQRIAIAEACGWELKSNGLSPMWSWQNESLTHRIKWVAHKEMASQGVLPDYLNDLNAMHEAERRLEAEDNHAYGCYCSELYEKYGNTVSLTAAQRAESFPKYYNLWKP